MKPASGSPTPQNENEHSFIWMLSCSVFQVCSHCLKISQNVAFDFFLILEFSGIFCPIKIGLSGNTV